MAGPKSMVTRNPLFLRDEDLDRSMELLLLAERGLLARIAESLGRHDLDEIDFRLLRLVQWHPSTTLAELGQALGVPKQSMSRHVLKLQERQLLRQETARSDRRKRPLQVTAEALAILGEILELEKRSFRRAFLAAGPEAVEGFQRVLGELAEPARRKLPGRAAA